MVFNSLCSSETLTCKTLAANVKCWLLLKFPVNRPNETEYKHFHFSRFGPTLGIMLFSFLVQAFQNNTNSLVTEVDLSRLTTSIYVDMGSISDKPKV
jgi:hypothetical protein